MSRLTAALLGMALAWPAPGAAAPGSNDAPVLDNTRTTVLLPQYQDSGVPAAAVGTPISVLVDFAIPAGQVDNVTDADNTDGDPPALLGIAVTAASVANGAWFYSTNGGGNWTALGAVSNGTARRLAADANTRIYFQPTAGFAGTIASAITFRAWDRSSGTNGTTGSTTSNGGITAYSTAVDTASLTVLPTPSITLRAAATGSTSGGTLVISTPTGTLGNDAMLAALAVRPRTSAITPPPGWSIVRRLDNSLATESSLVTYAKVAAAGEPPSQSWTISGALDVVGGIQSFSGVDAASPIHRDNGSTTASALTHATPSVIVSLTDVMLVTWHSMASSTSWSPPVGMTEAIDFARPLTAGDDGLALEGSWAPQPAVGQSGTKTATAASDADRGNAQIIALRPVTDNGAPVLNAARSPVLAPVNEGAGAPSGAVGTLVSTLVDFASPAGQVDNVTDADSGALLGIAITAADTATGTWFYSINDGVAWSALDTVSESSARLLAADPGTRLYLQPAPDFSGNVSAAITFRAWDRTSGGNSMLAPTGPTGGFTAFSPQTDTASLAVAGTNDAPVITSTPPGTAFADVPYVYNATKTDPDGPGTAWSILEASHTCGGSIGVTTGVFTFTPFGPTPPPSCVISITVCDLAPPPNELCGFQTATINIVAANQPPVITSSPNVSVPENQTSVLTVTSNDPDGGSPMYSRIGGADMASFAINASSGVLTFVVAPNFEAPTDAGANNVYEVTVQVSDGNGGTAMQAIGVTVTNANDPPVINSTALATATEDTLYTYNATRTDADGPGQTWTLVGGTHTCGGSIVAATGVFTFTPAGPVPPANCVLAVQVCDGGAPNLCVSQMRTVTITAANDPPVINSTALATATEDTLYTYNATRTDPDGPGQAWTLVGGTHTCTGSIVAATGVFTFTPAGPVPPANCVLAVQVCDGGAPNFCVSQMRTVTITAVNDPPVINSTAPATATEDTLYTYNATRTDVDGPGQTWTLVAGTHTCGGSIVAATGVFTFTPSGPVPPANCVLAIQVCDGGTPNQCVPQSRTVTITAVNDPPAINSTAPTTAVAGTLYTYNATRTDPDGPAQTWNLPAATHTCGGSIVASTGVFTFTPAPPPPASCVVSVRVCDSGTPNECVTQSTTVTIAASNSAPTSTAPASASTSEDTALNFTGGNQLSVADVNGGNLTVILSVTNGTITMTTLTGLAFTVGDGTADTTMTFAAAQANLNTALASLRFASNADYNGVGALSFSTSDGVAAPVVKTVNLTITAVADIVNDTVTTNEDTTISFNAITGTNGAEADNFEGSPSVTGVTQGANGGVSSMGNGALMYSPAANFSGNDSFTYTVTSGGVTEAGTVNLSVTAVNDAPTLNTIPDPAPILTNAGLQTVNLTGIGRGAGDPVQTLTVTAVSNNVALIPNPTVTYTSPNATGSLAYTPVAGQSGSAMITVTVMDNGGTANGGVNTISRSFMQVVSNNSIFANGFE